MYKSIEVNDAQQIIKVITKNKLQNEIVIEIPEISLKIKTSGISEVISNPDPYKNRQYFIDENNEKYVLDINKDKYTLYFYTGDWKENAPIPDVHIVVGCDKYGDKSSQLELSYCLMDNDYIYIIKSLKLGGSGSIASLNLRAISKEQKIERRNILIDELKAETILNDKKEYICLCKIKKSDLYNPNKFTDIAFEFWSKFLRYTFEVQKIIEKH
jgi:hypothetical protein